MDKIKSVFNTCLEDLEHKIQQITSKNLSPFEQSTQILPHVFEALKKVDKAILISKFINEDAEIHFFKTLKPKLVALEKYHRKIIEIESNNKSLTADQLANYLSEISNIKPSKKDQEVHKYYKLRCSHQDSNYFLLKQNINHIPFISSKEYFNPNTTSYHSEKFAQFIADEMIENYVKQRLHNVNADTVKNKLVWTDNKTALIELIYALHSQGSFNNAKADIKDIADQFCAVFDIDLGEFYRAFVELRNRKTGRTKFLDSLRENLLKKMDIAEEK
jgi:hypothetical protein